MGQRTQVLIKYKDNKENIQKLTFHNQWGFGRLLIYAGYAIGKALETGILRDSFDFGFDKDEAGKRLAMLMNSNAERGILTFFHPEDDFYYVSECDNNNGFLLLDLTDLEKPKYAYVLDKYDEMSPAAKNEGFIKITAQQYWNLYRSWYEEDNGENDKELEEYLNIIAQWAEYIDTNFIRMDRREIFFEYYLNKERFLKKSNYFFENIHSIIDFIAQDFPEVKNEEFKEMVDEIYLLCDALQKDDIDEEKAFLYMRNSLETNTAKLRLFVDEAMDNGGDVDFQEKYKNKIEEVLKKMIDDLDFTYVIYKNRERDNKQEKGKGREL